jgi:hypothetical protein
MVSKAVAAIGSLSVGACERAFHCELHPDRQNPGRYRGNCSHLNISSLDVRIGSIGGAVVAYFDERVQQGLAKEAVLMGAPEKIEVVSPPMSPAASPVWSRKWSEAHTIGGARIWFGLLELEGCVRLVSVSRTFPSVENSKETTLARSSSMREGLIPAVLLAS